MRAQIQTIVPWPARSGTSGFVLWLLVGASFVTDLYGQSALPRISGFDEDRIQWVYPLGDQQAVSELAKLLYRLARLDASTLPSIVSTGETLRPGDLARFEGQVVSVETVAVPAELNDVLGIATIADLKVMIEQATVHVMTADLENVVAQGDRVSGWGVVVNPPGDGEPGSVPFTALATAHVQWFPSAVDNDGWRLLRDADVDIALLAGLALRNRRPLQAEDSDAFYSLLAAAASIGDRAALPDPAIVDPVAMLKAPQRLVGQWLQLDLETVQISKVLVTHPDRQRQLGQDHYFQIDAVGDLENVVVRIEPIDQQGQPALFSGRYPISIVTTRLPEFLAARLVQAVGRDTVSAQLRTKIGVDAFFFRLWSYRSDFMDQHGGGHQIGPLLIAAKVTDREPRGTGGTGVEYIGAIAAIAVIGGILLTVWWQRRVAAADRAAQLARRQRATEQLEIPSRST